MRRRTNGGGWAVLLAACLSLTVLSTCVSAAKVRQNASSRREAAAAADLDVSATYECLVARPAGASIETAEAKAARVEAAANVLRAVPGVKVNGAFNGLLSLRMTPREAESSRSALAAQCASFFKSTPFVKGLIKRNNSPNNNETRHGDAPDFDTRQAMKAMLLDKVLEGNPALTGAGVTIGIMSDSFNVLQSDKFPCAAVAETTVLSEGPEDASDEGRAMAELICFIAPDAKLMFWSGYRGIADFAHGVTQLHAAGCDIIVDDLGYIDEAWHSPDVLLQAVELVTAAGTAYFTAAGNDAGYAWDGPANFLDLGESQPAPPEAEDNIWHNWGTAEQPITWLHLNKMKRGTNIVLQWDEAFRAYTGNGAGAVSDLDLWLCPKVPKKAKDFDKCVVSDNDNLDDGNPLEYVEVGKKKNPFLAVRLYSTPRNPADIIIKVVTPFGRIQAKPDQNGVQFSSATTCQHGNTEGAASVGAAWYQMTPGYGVSPALLEPYSSWGVQPLYLDSVGNRLNKPKVLLKPDFIAPDGTETSFFYDYDGTGVFQFYGTSAAAPNAAAVAALMLQQTPALKPLDLMKRLKASAADMFVDDNSRQAPRQHCRLPRGGRFPHADAPANTNTTTVLDNDDVDDDVPTINPQPTPGPDRFTGAGFLNAEAALAPVCFTGKCCNVDSLSFKQDGTTCAYDLSDALLQPTTTTTTAIASTNSNSFRRQLTHKEHPEDWPLCSGTCQRGTCALAPQRKAGCCRLALPQAQPGVDGVSLTQAVWRTVDVSGKTSNAARWTLTCWQG